MTYVSMVSDTSRGKLMQRSTSDSASAARKITAAHRDALARGELRISNLWAQPCLAYNVILAVPPPAATALAAAADALDDSDSALLKIPMTAFHISVAWLLAVHVEYSRPKSDLWATSGPAWMAELRDIASTRQPFTLTYRALAVTDAAVIALAEPAAPVNALRQQIATRMSLPAETHNTAKIVHTTLFRFAAPLLKPHGLMDSAEKLVIDIPVRVSELVVVQETVYPSMHWEALARMPLGR
jgi:hypothetical protein